MVILAVGQGSGSFLAEDNAEELTVHFLSSRKLDLLPDPEPLPATLHLPVVDPDPSAHGPIVSATEPLLRDAVSQACRGGGPPAWRGRPHAREHQFGVAMATASRQTVQVRARQPEVLMSLDRAVEAFRSAAAAFAQGNPEPVKSAYSHAEDVTLANPFGLAVRGWENVSAALDYASSRFSDGEVTEFKNVARYESADLVTCLDTEHWRTRVGGGDHAEFDLRVTSTYRKEDGEWKLVLRHADPISSADPMGPLRRTS